MSTKANENFGSKDEAIKFLHHSTEALRMENTRLMDENERLTNNIEVQDAEVVSNQMHHYYQFMNNFNYTLKNK